MVKYDLNHLTQGDSQEVVGPIQDDEALFLYSLIRGNRLKKILEIGGGIGYSATNFLKATEIFPDSVVITVDINPINPINNKHKCIIKDAQYLTVEDLGEEKLDLIFFDCHEYDIQMNIYNNLKEKNLIDEETIIALHDTNLHYIKLDYDFVYKIEEGFVHQPVERKMANTFKDFGYDIFSIRTQKKDHDESLPFRHGLTVCQKFKYMKT
jgi:hypothetical protein